jgi:hypothetical protein
MTTLLAAILTLWEPLTFASALATGRSLAFRGPIAIVEIAAVGIIAVVSVAASWSLLNGAPHGVPLARIALIATTVREGVALYWTRLPSNVAPGTRGLYAAMMIAHAIAWLTYLARVRRRLQS